LKNNLDNLGNLLKNPLLHIRNWIGGEIMNMESLIAAISELQACITRKNKSIQTLNEERE
jgi:hypothetical protein